MVCKKKIGTLLLGMVWLFIAGAPMVAMDQHNKITRRALRGDGGDTKGDRSREELSHTDERHEEDSDALLAAERDRKISYNPTATAQLIDICNRVPVAMPSKRFVVQERIDLAEQCIVQGADINMVPPHSSNKSLVQSLISNMRANNARHALGLLHFLLQKKPNLSLRDRFGKDALVEALDPVYDQNIQLVSTKSSSELDAEIVSMVLEAGSLANNVYIPPVAIPSQEMFGWAPSCSVYSLQGCSWAIQYAYTPYVIMCVAMARQNETAMQHLLDAGAPLVWRDQRANVDTDICTWASMRGIPVMPLKREIESRLQHNEERRACSILLAEHLPVVLCDVVGDYRSSAAVVPAMIPQQLHSCKREEQFSALVEEARIKALQNMDTGLQRHRLKTAIGTNDEPGMRALLAAGAEIGKEYLYEQLNSGAAHLPPLLKEGLKTLERLEAERLSTQS